MTETAPPEPEPRAPAEGRSRGSREEEEHPFGKPPKDLPPFLPGPASRDPGRSGVELHALDLSRKSHRRRFLAMVKPIYAGDPNFIMPLWMERMHFLDPAANRGLDALEILPLVAERDGKIVGRITAHVDRRYDEYHGTKAGWFGFFECIDDTAVAHALLDRAVRWLKDRGCAEVIGPMNFTTNHTAGLLVENFNRPACVEMTYNPPYYERLLTSFGFGKAKDLLAWWIDVTKGTDNPKVARIARIADKIKKREGVVLRHANMKKFAEEREKLFVLYNEAWQKNWGFVPVTKEGFDAIANELKNIVIPELLLFVEVNDKPVAFSLTLPDVNELMPRNGRLLPFGWWRLLTGLRKVTYARLFTLGVVPAYRKRGLESMLFVETALRARELGMKGGEIGWTLEDNNLINSSVESMDGWLDRRYRLLGMSL